MSEITEETIALAKKGFAKERSAQRALANVSGALRFAADFHNERRKGALEAIWKEKGLYWCSLGEHEALADEIKHLLFRNRVTQGWGEYDTWQAEVEYKKLHTACVACRKANKEFELIDPEYDLGYRTGRSQDERFAWPEGLYKKYRLPPEATVRIHDGGGWVEDWRGDSPNQRLFIGEKPIKMEDTNDD